MSAGRRLTVPLWLALTVIGTLWVLANALAVGTVLRRMPPGDWENYYAAGATAGTRALLDPTLHHAWQATHHFPLFEWQYMPGAAWLFAPFAWIDVTHGYVIFVALMVLAAIASAVILARIYALRIDTAVLATFAWIPTTTGIIFGQSAPLGLLLESFGITGIVTGSAWLAGVSIGLLLYKPTDALPFIVLLAVRRWWRALSVVALCAAGWYVVSAFAAAGDALWLPHYLHAQRGDLASDIGAITGQAISVPKLLEWIHVPPWLIVASSVAIFAIAVPKFAKAPALEAASIAPVIGIAASPHVWSHELTLILPTLFLLMRNARGIVLLCYGLAATWVYWPVVGFNPEAFIVWGLMLFVLLRRSTFAPMPYAAGGTVALKDSAL